MTTRWNRRGFLAAVAAAPALHGAALPRPALQKTYPAPNGTISLASYKGKVIALEFLNTTCPACQHCSRLLQKMFAEYGAKGFQPLGIATNVTPANAGQILAKYRLDTGAAFPLGWCNGWEEVSEFLQLSVFTPPRVPQLAFIDKKMMVRAQYSGSDPFFREEEKGMRTQIEALLK